MKVTPTRHAVVYLKVCLYLDKKNLWARLESPTYALGYIHGSIFQFDYIYAHLAIFHYPILTYS